MGGTAGGVKYVQKGILFKLADGHSPIYGNSDEAAAKAMGHELKSVNSYFRCGIRDLHVALQAVIDYRGFRILAQAVLPIDTTTLVLGSSDAGRTMQGDMSSGAKLLWSKLKFAANELNLAEHTYNDVTIHTACDVEGHVGHDGRCYIIDLARTFPPESPLCAPHIMQQRQFRVGQPVWVRVANKRSNCHSNSIGNGDDAPPQPDAPSRTVSLSDLARLPSIDPLHDINYRTSIVIAEQQEELGETCIHRGSVTAVHEDKHYDVLCVWEDEGVPAPAAADSAQTLLLVRVPEADICSHFQEIFWRLFRPEFVKQRGFQLLDDYAKRVAAGAGGVHRIPSPAHHGIVRSSNHDDASVHQRQKQVNKKNNDTIHRGSSQEAQLHSVNDDGRAHSSSSSSLSSSACVPDITANQQRSTALPSPSEKHSYRDALVTSKKGNYVPASYLKPEVLGRNDYSVNMTPKDAAPVFDDDHGATVPIAPPPPMTSPLGRPPLSREESPSRPPLPHYNAPTSSHASVTKSRLDSQQQHKPSDKVSPVALSSDALSRFGSSDINFRKLDDDVCVATDVLVRQLIPALVS